MNVVGLHPEELIDKLLDGELSSAERVRLEQHLTVCEVCRFEHAARLDFQAEALELAAPSGPPSSPLHPPQRDVAGPPPRQARAHRRKALVWGVAAAAVVTAGAALASGLTGTAPWRRVVATFAPPERPAAAAAVGKAQQPALGVEQHAVASSAAPSSAAPSSAASVAHERAVPQRASVLAAVRRGAPARPAKPSPPAAAEAPNGEDAGASAAKARLGAAELFSEANRARRSGDIGRASGLYHLLQDEFPGSAEADLSRVTLALLQLDSGDSQAALGGFERYLAGPSRALEAEALVGRARALGRLGRRDQEVAAWQEVERKYPSSVYGRQAVERLAALGQP